MASTGLAPLGEPSPQLSRSLAFRRLCFSPFPSRKTSFRQPQSSPKEPPLLGPGPTVLGSHSRAILGCVQGFLCLPPKLEPACLSRYIDEFKCSHALRSELCIR